MSVVSILALGNAASAQYDVYCQGEPIATWTEELISNMDMHGGTSYSWYKDIKILKEKDAWKLGKEGECHVFNIHGDEYEDTCHGFGVLPSKKSTLSFPEQFKKVLWHLWNATCKKIPPETEMDFERDECYLDGQQLDIMYYMYNPITNKYYMADTLEQTFVTLDAAAAKKYGDFQKTIEKKGIVECSVVKQDEPISQPSSATQSEAALQSEQLTQPEASVQQETVNHSEAALQSEVNTQPEVSVQSEVVNQPEVVMNQEASMPVSSHAQVMSKKDFIALKNQPLFVVMKHFGYAQDKNTRKQLAANYGISSYVGTKAQNLELKNKLLNQIESEEKVVLQENDLSVDTIAQLLEGNTFTLAKKDFASYKQQPLFVLVERFGLNYKKSRKALAAYFGIKNYIGSWEQNMLIKNQLLTKITVN